MDSFQLEEYVVNNGLVNPDQLRIARRECKKSAKQLSQVLIDQCFLTPLELSEIEGRLHGIKILDLSNIEPDREALLLLSPEQARALTVLPVSLSSECRAEDATVARMLVVAVENAHDVNVLDKLTELIEGSFQFDIRLSSRVDILNAIDRFYGIELSIDALLCELDAERSTDAGMARSTDEINRMANQLVGDSAEKQAPVVRLVDAVLQDAVRRSASDIHFEPERTHLRIRYRLDGVLCQIRSLHLDYWKSMLVRLKVLCGLDISETRMAQDGRMSVRVIGRELDVRVSCFPGVYGECLVLRLLDCYASLRPLNRLGISSAQAKLLTQLVRQPQGLIMVTGPTGSGKSTTLYSLVNEIRGEKINIVTMEDPVEYRLEHVRQCSVNPALKLDFASGIRSMLRQDPDVILVGETRDLPTAEMVVKAVLTGHLVMTTLHAHSALGSITRLRELGIDTSQLSGLILALLAQRLLRLLCKRCKRPAKNGTRWFEPEGCPECGGLGYRGRIPIVEIISPDRQLNELLTSGAQTFAHPGSEMRFSNSDLLAVAVDLLVEGRTSVEEVHRVLGVSEEDIVASQTDVQDAP